MENLLPKIGLALVGAYISFLFAKKFYNYKRRTEAAEEFRNTFLNELDLCKTRAKSDEHGLIIRVLTNNLSTYNKAILKYRPYIPKSKIPKFDEACSIFTKYESRLNLQFADISGISQQVDIKGLDENKIREKVRRVIEKLYEFASIE